MGSWIYHIRIAEDLLQRWPSLDPMTFVCGSLAPDSGRPSADWSSFDPPKEVTHFLRPKTLRPRIADLDFYRAYIAAQSHKDALRCAFSLGYFCHLLADNLWIVQVEPASRSENAELFARMGEAAWNTIKQDWYDLDRLYLASHPECLYWRFQAKVPAMPRYLEFLDWDSLYEQYDYMRAFYQQPSDQPLERGYKYLNQSTMARCVADSGRKIAWLVERLADRLDTGSAPSAVAWLPQEDLVAYAPPLGDR